MFPEVSPRLHSNAFTTTIISGIPTTDTTTPSASESTSGDRFPLSTKYTECSATTAMRTPFLKNPRNRSVKAVLTTYLAALQRFTRAVAVDETLIRLDDQQYWLYATVDPERNDLRHTKREPTRNNSLTNFYFSKIHNKYGVDDAIFFLDGAFRFTKLVKNTASISETNDMETKTASNVSFVW